MNVLLLIVVTVCSSRSSTPVNASKVSFNICTNYTTVGVFQPIRAECLRDRATHWGGGCLMSWITKIVFSPVCCQQHTKLIFLTKPGRRKGEEPRTLPWLVVWIQKTGVGFLVCVHWDEISMWWPSSSGPVFVTSCAYSLLPVLLMTPVLIGGNISRCQMNSSEPYRWGRSWSVSVDQNDPEL